MTRGKTPKIVEVEWIDSAGRSRWCDRTEAVREHALARCRSIGYLLHRDATRITLAQSHEYQWDDVNNTISIPVVAVTKTRRIR